MHYTRLELYDLLKNRFLRTNGARTRGGGRKLEKLVKGLNARFPSIYFARGLLLQSISPLPPNTFHPRSKVFVRFSRGEGTGKKGEKGSSSRKISRRKTRGSIHNSLSELGESRDFKIFFFFFRKI